MTETMAGRLDYPGRLASHVSARMKSRLAIPLLTAIFCQVANAEEIEVGMSLFAVQALLDDSGAERDLYAYHFPWTTNSTEAKVLDGETRNQGKMTAGTELAKLSAKNGYSVFYTLNDNTRLELVLEVDGNAKVLHVMRLGEPTLEYKGKLDWIAAGEEGRLRVVTSLDLKR